MEATPSTKNKNKNRIQMKFYNQKERVFILPESKHCIIYRPSACTFVGEVETGMVLIRGVVGWYRFGKLHRAEGPAIIWGNRGEYINHEDVP